MKPDADPIKCHKIKATLQGCLYRLLSITTLKLNNSNELYSYKVPWTKNQKTLTGFKLVKREKNPAVEIN